jgi:preprotein translocase subunit SecE
MAITQRIQSFFKEVYLEMRKVNWLDRQDILKYTMIVLFVTIVVAAFLGGLDYLFAYLIKTFIISRY